MGLRIGGYELPEYSVMMSVYDQELPENLNESLESMLMQSYPPSDFVLVCDGKLTNELNIIAKSFQDEYKTIFRIIQINENVGVGKAYNIGIEACKCDYIVKMDSDDIALPDRCEKQLTFMTAHHETDILGGFIEEFDDLTGETVAVRSTPVTHAEIMRYARRRSPFNNQTLMLCKRAVTSAGGYDTVGRCEDYDLAVRMLQNGAKAANLPDILVRYRVSAGNLERRRDLRNTLDFIAVRRKIHRSGFSSLADLLIPCAAQLALFLLPSQLTGRLYKRFLRG